MILGVRVSINSPVNQDATVVLITKTEQEPDGKIQQYYVSHFVWSPYRGLDMLDVQDVAFAGTKVLVTAPHFYESGSARQPGGT